MLAYQVQPNTDLFTHSRGKLVSLISVFDVNALGPHHLSVFVAHFTVQSGFVLSPKVVFAHFA